MDSVVVAIEGLPGGGKSRLAADLSHQGIPIVDEVLGEDGNPVPPGKRGIRPQQFYRDSDMRKMAQARTHPYAVLDRSYLSTLAYSLCRGEYEHMLTLFDEPPEPEYYIVIDIPPALSVKRTREKQPNLTGIWTDETSLQQTLNFYSAEWKKRPGRVLHIDGTQPYETVLAAVMQQLRTLGVPVAQTF